MHFIEKKHGAHHKYRLGYHPQTNSQVEISNHEIKSILAKLVIRLRKDWVDKLDNTLWAYIMAFNTNISATPFWLVYGKPCHISTGLEHKAY